MEHVAIIAVIIILFTLVYFIGKFKERVTWLSHLANQVDPVFEAIYEFQDASLEYYNPNTVLTPEATKKVADAFQKLMDLYADGAIPPEVMKSLTPMDPRPKRKYNA